jgi:hopene-associated glycosyltransferase HpnB
VERPYLLLLDADIELAPDRLPALLDRLQASGGGMVSVMAELRCDSLWERLLVPPFIYFFKLIYPFARVNDRNSRVAAAAGGCILIESTVLQEIGGFAAIRAALIDDCALAGKVKRAGYPIWLGLSHSVRSQRSYVSLHSFASMVTRTAFTQLAYSTVLLMVVTLLMLLLFVVPVLGLLPLRLGELPPLAPIGLLALLAMFASYLPTVRFYGLPLAWSLTLPLAALLFLGMTWCSAAHYWRGRKALWKDRVYASSSGQTHDE